MIKRLTMALAAMLTLAAAPVAATDLTNMSEVETDAFGAAVRAYLLENPEVLMEVIAVLEQRQAEAEAMTDQTLILTNYEDLVNDGYSAVLGNPDGDITIVEFLDYKCGFCKRAFPEVKELLASDGNIRLIIKEFPILGDESLLGSRFAIATQMVEGDEAYGRLHDELMTMRANISEESLLAVAERLEIDGPAILARMEDPVINQIISNNHLLAQRMQISGTPSFVIGNQMLRGYVPLEGMQQVVAAERAPSDG
ncbi:MAG TPA: DsbA family protein [Aliiroseovarius sp.]|nr:DsbA family protein [Aliiroseovarius sp.]